MVYYAEFKPASSEATRDCRAPAATRFHAGRLCEDEIPNQFIKDLLATQFFFGWSFLDMLRRMIALSVGRVNFH